MDELPAPPPLAQAAPLLMVAAFVVLLLAAHVATGYTRLSVRETRPLMRWVSRACAAVALGSGLWAAMVLGLTGEAQSYALGFNGIEAAGAWAVAVLATALALAPWALGPRPVIAGVSGALLAAAALVTQMLLVRATGLQPGVTWRAEALALAPLLAASGCIAGFWVAFIGPGQRGRLRRRWRWLAAAMLTFGVVVAQDLVLVAAGIAAQNTSEHHAALSAMKACLVAAMGAPLLMLVFEVDLSMRRGVVAGVVPQARRRRTRTRVRQTPG